MIAILMATYNSMPYLSDQIESIISQDSEDWHLYIHDDGSTDGTTDMLKCLSERYEKQITILDYPPQGGACNNFMSLLERVNAPYYMFCDHDDVWHKNKVSCSMDAMREQEKEASNLPIIVHCDLCVVEDDLTVRHPSMRVYSHIYPEKVKTLEDCVINTVTGCTMLFNRKARDLAIQSNRKYAIMHDAWITVVTYANQGVVYAMPEVLIDYRQSERNAIGAIDGKQFTLRFRIRNAPHLLKLNIQQYKMLKSIGYPSLLTFIRKKIQLHIRA